MGLKKRKPTNSQVNGIIWITVVLAAILAIIFFYKQEVPERVPNDTVYSQNRAELEKMEDSVYRSRQRQKSHYRRPTDTATHETTTFYSSDPPTPTRQPLIVELNSADTTTLMLLHGIGPAFARRIVKYRDRLGGFTSTHQLLEVYGFTPDLLDHIAPHLRLDTTNLRTLNVNTIPLKQLIKHPYVEYYFARDLVNLRSHGVPFSSVDDLRTLPTATDTMLARLLPYLDFTPVD